jgi:hypothetical protein
MTSKKFFLLMETGYVLAGKRRHFSVTFDRSREPATRSPRRPLLRSTPRPIASKRAMPMPWDERRSRR